MALGDSRKPRRFAAADPDAADGGDWKFDPFVPRIHPPESLAELKLRLSWRVIGTGRMWRRLLDDQLKVANQSQPRWRVLAWARIRPGISQTELAARMGISGPALVGLLDGLASAGLIERRPSPDDRRVNQIHLTPDAQPVVEQISGRVTEIRESLLEGIPPEELRTCLSVLERVTQRIAASQGGSDQGGSGR